MADEKSKKTEDADVEADAATPDDGETVVAPAAEAETVEAEAVAADAVEEPAAEAEEPVAEAVEEPAEADEAEAEAVDEPVAEVAAAEPPKRKKKRLPRALRPARTRPKRQPSAERKAIVRLPKPDADRGRRQERQGTVVSDAMDKTIVVKVEVVKAHRRYKKVIRRSVKFHAHDEGNQAKVGDVVRIVETRPLSATKRWRLVEIVEAAR